MGYLESEKPFLIFTFQLFSNDVLLETKITWILSFIYAPRIAKTLKLSVLWRFCRIPL